MAKSVPQIDYQRLFDSLPGPYIAFLPDDPAFTIVAENQAHAEIGFVSPKDTLGKPLFEIFPDTSDKYRDTGVSDLLESLRTVIRTGRPDEMPLLHYDLRDMDGKFVEKWWQVTHYPVFDDDGRVSLVYQATNDITAEVLSNRRLALAKNQLDAALAVGLVSTWYWDITSDLVIGDANLARGFGMDPAQAAAGLPLKKFTDLVHPDDRDRVVQAIRRSVEAGVDYREEYRIMDGAGEIRWVIARGKLDTDAEAGGKTSLLGVLFDITDRKAAEADLEHTKRMFNALFESRIVSIVMANMNGDVLRANRTFLETFGYDSADLAAGLHSRDITPKYSSHLTDKILSDLKSHGEAEPIEKEYVRKNGSVVPMLVGAAMLPQNTDLFVAFMLDISENKQLKALNRAKDEFIEMASHQLRTPATAVKQYISLLQTGFAGPLNPDQQAFANKAFAGNERQINIVNDLLKTAQIDSNQYSLDKEYVGIAELARKAVEELEDTAHHKRQTIAFTDDSDGAKLHVDRTEINLVLTNLIENASKYSPNGTSITVSVSNVPGLVRITVGDQGVGMGPNDTQRIFQKFTRINNSLSDTVSGSGLGLYWVKRIVRLHGGNVSVESEIGKGSRFIVDLPYE